MSAARVVLVTGASSSIGEAVARRVAGLERPSGREISMLTYGIPKAVATAVATAPSCQ